MSAVIRSMGKSRRPNQSPPSAVTMNAFPSPAGRARPSFQDFSRLMRRTRSQVGEGRAVAGRSPRSAVPAAIARVRAAGQAGIAWRIIFVSLSLGGLRAATAAGLGVVLRTTVGCPSSVGILDPAPFGLTELAPLGRVLHRAGKGNPVADRLASLIGQALRETPPKEWSVTADMKHEASSGGGTSFRACLHHIPSKEFCTHPPVRPSGGRGPGPGWRDR